MHAVMGSQACMCGVAEGRGGGGAWERPRVCERCFAAGADLAEVAGMVLVEHDAVVVLATSVTATARMLPVLPDTSVAGTDMTPLLAVLAETCAAANTAIQTSAHRFSRQLRSALPRSPQVGVGGQTALLSTVRSNIVLHTAGEHKAGRPSVAGDRGGCEDHSRVVMAPARPRLERTSKTSPPSLAWWDSDPRRLP